MDYVNCRGTRYYVFEGKTKSGKPKYYASRKNQSDCGVLVDSLPGDFEVYEDLASHVVIVRRRKATKIVPAEAELVQKLANELSQYSTTKVQIDGNFIVVHTPDRDPEAVASTMAAIFGVSMSGNDWTLGNTRYTAVLRFKLCDIENRKYSAQRFCFRGAIDDWVPISDNQSLETLARKYLPLLGDDLFEVE
ncbi:MAG: hypothetical protein ABL888_20795, partial [Pirellulaceae bacterium]